MILGCEEPRIFTPPRRELVAGDEDGVGRTTDGFAAIAFAENVLQFRLFPWQRWLLIHALELNEDGTYRFRYVITLVARQNGKSLLLLVLALWHIYALHSEMVIGTAQDLARADKAWEQAVEFAENDDELSELIVKTNRGHPKYMKLTTGCEYRVSAATRRGARGFSGDLILLDELREHTSWDSWAAVSNTMNARPRAQAWAFSNAGDALSIVLRYLRAQAHRGLGWPDGDSDSDVLEALDAEMEEYLEQADSGDMLGLFEWSAPPNSRRNDMSALAQANPSLNHTGVVADCITERALMAALRTNPPHLFDIEVRCLWITMADAGPFPEGSWRETLDNDAKPEDGRRVMCVDVNWNRSRTYIARAGRDVDCNPVVAIAADRAGTDWAIPWLVEHRDTYEGIVVQSNGAPVTSLLDEMEDRGLPVIKLAGTDLGSSTALLFDKLDLRKIRHLAHPGLDAAATTAAVKVLPQGAWVIDRVKSPTDASPLQAAIGAVWGLETFDDPQVSVYASEELLVL